MIVFLKHYLFTIYANVGVILRSHVTFLGETLQAKSSNLNRNLRDWGILHTDETFPHADFTFPGSRINFRMLIDYKALHKTSTKSLINSK